MYQSPDLRVSSSSSGAAVAGVATAKPKSARRRPILKRLNFNFLGGPNAIRRCLAHDRVSKATRQDDTSRAARLRIQFGVMCCSRDHFTMNIFKKVQLFAAVSGKKLHDEV